MKKEIAYQKAMLFQQSKMAMGEMINNIAHQWRQPLNLLGVIIQDCEYAYKAGKVDRELRTKNPLQKNKNSPIGGFLQNSRQKHTINAIITPSITNKI